MSKHVPSTISVLLTLVRVTLRRFMRGRALWVVLVISLLPTLVAVAHAGRSNAVDAIAVVQLVVMALLPAVFVASAIGEEIEDRTTTYLWSRPIARWTVVFGKLLALAPIAATLLAGGWALAVQIATDAPPALQGTLAFAAGGIAVSMIAAAIALLVPKHGMALSIIYLVVLDTIIGGIPASLQTISVTRQVRLLADVDHTSVVEPAITMAAIGTLWLVVGLLRLRKLES
jgi:ABC-type transport system involved in multi-copper enzyme maturation permease subunit